MKYKATEKFKALGTENSYQQLHTDDYNALKAGKAVELKTPPSHLIKGKYIERAK